MIAHKRYLNHRTTRQENQNRWLTVLSGAIIVVVIVAVTTGPSLVRATADIAADFSTEADSQASAQYRH